MILPDDLAPLPVSPRGDEPAGSHVACEDFVSPGDVRNVLLGGRAGLPVECLPADDFDSFAGRADVPFPGRSPFRSKTPPDAGLPMPDLALETPTIHPAFEVLPPSARRAAPPRAQAAAVDCEASFGSPRLADRWWVIGMGLAAAAVLFSGTLVDFISREAVRRSLPAAPALPGVVHRPAPASGPALPEPAKHSLAATVEADEEE